jgi:ABC-2 type transport system permease protein
MAADTTTTTRRAPSRRTAANGAAATVPVARWVLREQRRSLLLWAIALAAIAAMYLSFYPAMGANEDMESLIAGLPEALQVGMGWDRIGTAAGYLESTVYALLAPALLLVFAIATGARLLAGEEEAGTLELEGTAPVSRRSLLLQRYGVLALDLALLCLALAAATVGMVAVLDMDVTAPNILAATLGLWLFVLAMGSLTFAVGAATGRRALALGVGAGVAVASYMANAIGPMADGLGWLEDVSPFGWYLRGDPLTQGIDPIGFGGLLVLVLVTLGVGLVTYDRRDLGV